MQQDVPSIFIYFNDRIAPAEVRIKWVRPTGISTGATAWQIKLSISVSPTPSQTQTLYRFGLAQNAYKRSPSFPLLLRHRHAALCAAVKFTRRSANRLSTASPLAVVHRHQSSVSQLMGNCSQGVFAQSASFVARHNDCVWRASQKSRTQQKENRECLIKYLGG